MRRQLHRVDVAVKIVPPAEFGPIAAQAEFQAEVAFVDIDAEFADGSPVFRALGAMAKDCQVILVCEAKDSHLAADIARRWEVFDYLRLDSVFDPDRAAMLVERARGHCLADLSELLGRDKRQSREILKLLTELRAILKSRGDHPVVDFIQRYKAEVSPLSQVDGGWLAGVYQHCLIDVICGRLKKLEQEFRSSHDRRQETELDPSRPMILLVEDSEICAEIARHILESHGLDVIVAPTAELAKVELEKRTPSLIVMDVHLGTANGLRLLNALRHGGRCPDVPVIICSADRMASTVQVAASLNVQGYLLKPYNPSGLVAMVKTALSRSTLRPFCAARETVGTAS
ncbi:MAG: response regulator [Thermoguttaceae bacterium]